MYCILLLLCRKDFDEVCAQPLLLFTNTIIMAELEAIKQFFKGVIKESVNEALAEAVPKYLEKKKERYYTVDEACEILGIGRTALYDRIKAGTLKTKKRGNSRLIYAEELDQRVKANKAGRYVHYRKRK